MPEAQTVLSTRQVVDIPPVRPVYTEYRQYGCRCATCAHFQRATYPEGVTPIQYGARVEAYVTYLSVYQYVPYQRLCLLLKDVFGLSISEGSISNLLQRAAKKASPVYEQIQAELKTAGYVGSDETGVKVNGTSWWVWCWQNLQNTFLKASSSRGSQTVAAAVRKRLFRMDYLRPPSVRIAGLSNSKLPLKPNNFVLLTYSET